MRSIHRSAAPWFVKLALLVPHGSGFPAQLPTRLVDLPPEPKARARHRLEARLLANSIDGPKEVQELSADRSVRLELEHAELLGHVLH